MVVFSSYSRKEPLKIFHQYIKNERITMRLLLKNFFFAKKHSAFHSFPQKPLIRKKVVMGDLGSFLIIYGHYFFFGCLIFNFDA